MKVRVVIQDALYPHRRQIALCSVQWTILNIFFSQTLNETVCLIMYLDIFMKLAFLQSFTS